MIFLRSSDSGHFVNPGEHRLAVEILNYFGSLMPACFSVNIIRLDGGHMFTTLHRCHLADDANGVEINNRIAELERLAEDGPE